MNLVLLENPTKPSYVTFTLPCFPCFVVIRTTPLAAREPYKAAAAASFNTSTDKISAGLISANALALPTTFVLPVSAKLPDCIGTPSTIYKGPVPEVMEFTPRICTIGACPTPAEGVVTLMPDARPCNIWSILVLGASFRDSALTEETEAVKVLAF